MITITYDSQGNVVGLLDSRGAEIATYYYDARVCRFINADDVSFMGISGTVWAYNLYSYCENNPIKYTDPYV